MARLVSASATEPVTLVEVKAYAKVEHTDEDTLLTALITSCRQEIEERTKLTMVTQVWEERLDSWPRNSKGVLPIWSPRVPLSGTTVTIVDSTGTFVAVDASKLDGEPSEGRLVPIDNLPVPARAFGGIKVQFTSTISTVSPVLKTALLELITYRYDNRSNGGDAAVAGWPASVVALLGPLRMFCV